MCKPAPVTSNLTAVPIIVGAVAVAAVAMPVAHAALAVLHAVITITLITAVTISGLAVTTGLVLAVRHILRVRHTTAPAWPVPGPARLPAIAATAPAAITSSARLALPAPPLELTAADLARCYAAGADPELVAQIIQVVLAARHG
jgi:hypothetical protein